MVFAGGNARGELQGSGAIGFDDRCKFYGFDLDEAID